MTKAEESLTKLAEHNERRLQALLEEYKECNAGYAYRDELVAEEMVRLTSVFFGFAVVLGAIYKTSLHWPFHVLGMHSPEFPQFAAMILVGVTGLAFLLSMHQDLLATASTKDSLRARAQTIEVTLRTTWGLPMMLWKVIDDRTRFPDEATLKRLQKRSDSHLFLIASRLLVGSGVLLWASLLALLWFFPPR